MSFAAPLNPMNPGPDIRPSAKEIAPRRQAKVLFLQFLKKIFVKMLKKEKMILKFNRYKYSNYPAFLILDGRVVHIGCCP